MNIFHKIMIVLNFLLAIAVAVFGWLLFDQREIFKKRTSVLEQHAQDMAIALKWGDYTTHLDKELPDRYGDWSRERQEDEDKMKRDLQDYQLLHLGLKQMEQVATNRVATMVRNKLEWDEMDRRLAITNEVLAATIIKRDEWNAKYDSEVEAHDNTKAELQEKIAKIQSLEGEILGLRGEITALDEELSKRNQEIGKLRVELEGCYADALDLEEQLKACVSGDDITVVEDISASVLATEPEWNFVVIDVGKQQNIKQSSVAMVHRGDKLVGKVSISRVGEDVCIGQILDEWAIEGESIQPGDGIMF